MPLTFESTVTDVALECDLCVFVKGEEVVILRPIGDNLVEGADGDASVDVEEKPFPYVSRLVVEIAPPNFAPDPDA